MLAIIDGGNAYRNIEGTLETSPISDKGVIAHIDSEDWIAVDIWAIPGKEKARCLKIHKMLNSLGWAAENAAKKAAA